MCRLQFRRTPRPTRLPLQRTQSTQANMQKRILILIITFALAISVGAQTGPTDGNRAGSEHEQRQTYTCLMHPEVVTNHPGNCPKCGMKLVPMTEQKRPRSNAQRSTSKVGAIDPIRPRHEHDHPPSVAVATHGAAGQHEHEEMQMEMSMHSTIDLAEPMSREGSGTSWIADSSPMYGRMFMFGENMLMLHGAIFPRYTNVSTRRGDDRIDAPNWFMAMFSHPLGESTQFGSRLMMSLDPLTEGGRRSEEHTSE